MAEELDQLLAELRELYRNAYYRDGEAFVLARDMEAVGQAIKAIHPDFNAEPDRRAR